MTTQNDQNKTAETGSVPICANLLKRRFQNCYFIEGNAYAGKSTILRMLSERYGGILMRENYTEDLFSLIDPEHQPSLSYFETMSGWAEFLTRTPEEYAAWIDGCSREGTDLEIMELIRVTAEERPVFVDSNIPLSLLREISDYGHVAVMLTDPAMSVTRFFERPDKEKQFLWQELQKLPDPERAFANYRAILEKINSPERVREMEESGFYVFHRDDRLTLEETCDVIAKHFGFIG